MSLLFGGIPSLIIGAIGGVLVGLFFRQLPAQVSLPTALTVGIMGGALLLLPLTFIVVWLFFRGLTVDDLFTLGLIWGVPAAGALLGFAWVGQRLNPLLPSADRTFDGLTK